jgi:hypothetical protein
MQYIREANCQGSYFSEWKDRHENLYVLKNNLALF